MKRTVLIFCLLSGYMVLFFHLGSMPFFGADEPRYARIGQEMLESGNFITPTLDQRPWLEKPPFLYWMESASYALFGISEGSARLPNALLTLLAALGIGYLGWRITGEAWCGVFSYMVLISSYFFVIFGRAASTDMAFTVPYALMLVSAFLALEEESPAWAGLAGAWGALAVLAKGPVGIVLGAGTILVYLLILRRVPTVKILLAFFLVLAAVSLPWFILVWIANGENFFLTFIVNHHIARFVTDLHHHSQPFWYYVPVLVFGFFPWFFFLFPAARDFLREKKDVSSPEFRLRLFLWLWALIPLVFFSASAAKLAGYILPSIPAMALLVSLEWMRYRDNHRLFAKGVTLQVLLASFALLLAAGFPVGAKLEYGQFEFGLAAGIPLAAGILLGLWWGRKGAIPIAFMAIAGGMIVSMAALFAVGSPVIAEYHSTAGLVSTVDNEISEQRPLVQYRFFHHTAIYYTGGRITPASLNSPLEMADYIGKHPQEEYFLLTTRHGWEEFHGIQGTEIIGSAGKLYILKLRNQDRKLAERIRVSIK